MVPPIREPLAWRAPERGVASPLPPAVAAEERTSAPSPSVQDQEEGGRWNPQAGLLKQEKVAPGAYPRRRGGPELQPKFPEPLVELEDLDHPSLLASPSVVAPSLA